MIQKTKKTRNAFNMTETGALSSRLKDLSQFIDSRLKITPDYCHEGYQNLKKFLIDEIQCEIKNMIQEML